MSSVLKFSKVQWKANVINNILDEKEKALLAAGFQLEAYIKKSFTSVKGGGKIHIPSSPGQPPAVDTGRLKASVSTNWTDSGMTKGKVDKQAGPEDGIGSPGGKKNRFFMPSKFKVVVGTNVEYAPPLEFGAPSRHLLPRPFIRPAYDWLKPKLEKMLKRI